MRSAIIISDMFGKNENTEYLQKWRKWLFEEGFESRIVLIDDLLPEVYQQKSKISKEELHLAIINPDNIQKACQNLSEKIKLIQPDLLMGFSFGGFLAFCLRHELSNKSHVICVSATRLRFDLPVDYSPFVYALFGENDQNWSNTMNKNKNYLKDIIVPNIGHDLYHYPKLCKNDLKLIFKSLYKI